MRRRIILFKYVLLREYFTRIKNSFHPEKEISAVLVFLPAGRIRMTFLFSLL